MNFYLNMIARHANRRTFDAPDNNSGGAGDDAAKAAAEAAAKAAADAEAAKVATAAADAEAAKVAADAAAAEAKKTGKTVEELEAEKATILKEVMDKKNKLREAQDLLKAYNGVDPKKVKELIDRETAAEAAAAEAKGDFERVKQMMADAHKAEKLSIEAELATSKEANASQLKIIEDLTVGNAFGMSTYIKDSMVLSPAKTRTLYGDHFDIEEGKIVAFDKPRSSANRTKLVNSAGEPLAFDEALTKIVSLDPDKKSVLRSQAKPGAGSQTTPASTTSDAKNGGEVYGVSRIAASLVGL